MSEKEITFRGTRLEATVTATKAMARFLAAAGATRAERTRTGYLWMLP